LVLARPGWTSSELLQAMSIKDPQPLRRANAVSVWIGGDDLIRAGLAMLRGANLSVLDAALLRYRSDLSRIVRMLRGASPGRVLICTQYNPFPATGFVELAVGRLNRLMAETAAASGATLVPTHSWFQGRQRELIAGYRDGRLEDAMQGGLPLHPNDKGHVVIAKGLAALLLNDR
jgi:lysophospholipase L1-like esterase